jgi:lipopolysaccharide transport system ATP-binding protein
MSDVVVRFEGVGKMYKIFPSRRDNLLDAIGFRRLFGSSRDRYHEFWALRGIDLELKRGERLGIIGRNGAGKSTLLKLVTQNLPATEGRVEVHGNVQALLEIGGGLHPEFTGRENVHASLSFLGLNRDEIVEATEEIADFTELGRFLDQPFKTYSAGMQARLSVGIATSVRPEILILDEILGAGDAYFFAKSTARMRDLIGTGVSVLLVSHALEQVVRFCEEVVWIDRGRIAMRGPANEVVKAYERYIRELDDRRLRARNYKQQDAFERESHSDSVTVALTPDDGAEVEVREIALFVDGELEDRILVGDAQDGSPAQSAHIVLDAAVWGRPTSETDGFHRRIATRGDTAPRASAVFSLWFFYPDTEYTVEVTYRARGGGMMLEAGRGDGVDARTSLAETGTETWSTGRAIIVGSRTGDDAQRTTVSRWSGAGGLSIAGVRIVDEDANDQAIFEVGGSLSVLVDIAAKEAGRYPLIPAAIVFRDDGVIVTKHIGDELLLDLAEGEHVEGRLEIGPLMLGNGTYLISLGLYSRLDIDDVEPSEFYDYFDKSFEFQIIGNPRLHSELVRHPGSWRIASARTESAPQASSR